MVPLRAFTAFGTNAYDEIRQADEREFRPFRPRANYADTRPIPHSTIGDRLSDGLDTSYPDATSSPGLALWRVTNAWQRLMRAALAPHDVTHVQFVLLASLTWMDQSEPITQRNLATHAGTDVMMTSQVLRALEEKGLVARRQHPTDRRAIGVTVTQAGAALANRANRDVERADAAYFGLLSTTDRSQFVEYLLALDSPPDKHPMSSGH